MERLANSAYNIFARGKEHMGYTQSVQNIGLENVFTVHKSILQ